MLETIRSSGNFMLSLCRSRASTFFLVSAVFVFAFGSCKAGWYYRCLGLDPQKKSQGPKGNRLLISITVLGSAGPIRIVVNEEELVASVIDTALKSYAREGRRPVLGSHLNDFLLYCPGAGSDALNPWETIGSQGARNFILCKKPRIEKMHDDGRSSESIARKGSGNWKAWINKFLNLKISSHY